MDLREQLQTALSHRYAIERELGQGGMATVYLARDLKHDRLVALKLLRPELAAVLGADRFFQEIRLTAGLQHPRILPLLDSGTANGLLYYVMPYVEGESLRQHLAREGPLAVPEAVRLAQAVAGALDYAHQRGVIHRDIKPENILLSNNEPVVADFGIALAVSSAGGERLTETGLSLGTPAYMSPEQASAEQRLDGRSDQYSLACVLYEVLAGEPPYTGPTAQAIIAKRFSEPVPHLGTLRDVPPAVENAVTRALAKSPADRFSRMSDFAAALEQPTPTPAATSRAPAAPAQPRPKHWSVAVGVAFIGIATAAGLMWSRGPKRATAAGTDSAPTSLAVLPFEALGRDSTDQYLSDGISQELLGALGQVRGLTVAGRTSSFRFRGRDVNIEEVGRTLHVGAVLSGNVQRVDTLVRVSAELVDTRTGYQLWAGKYDRPFANLFVLEDDLAGAIVKALEIKLAPRGDRHLVAVTTRNPRAHDVALQAHSLLMRGDGPSLDAAVALYRQALALDSTYAEAWAGLSFAYGGLADSYRAPRTVVQLAKEAAVRAVQLDDSLAQAHLALATIYSGWEWNWAGASAEYARALALDGESSDTRMWHALTWLSPVLKQYGPADAEFERAAAQDPLNPWLRYFQGINAIRANRFDRALELARQVEELSGNSIFYTGMLTAQAYAAFGKWSDCVRESERAGVAADSTAFDAQSRLVACYARSGQRAKAKSLLARLEAARKSHYVDGVWMSHAYAGLGDYKQAIASLERAFVDRSASMSQIDDDHDLPAELRADRRFQAIVARVNVASAKRAR
jgi:serine/threonine-protein kinase